MANSLRAKIKKLKHDGNITDAECQELLNKLDGHDKAIINATIDEFAERICTYGTYDEHGNVVDVLEIAEQMKGE